MSFYINGALVMQATNVTVMPVGTDGTPLPLRVGAGATEGYGASGSTAAWTKWRSIRAF
jgi:hypothetical protein